MYTKCRVNAAFGPIRAAFRPRKEPALTSCVNQQYPSPASNLHYSILETVPVLAMFLVDHFHSPQYLSNIRAMSLYTVR